MTDAGIDVSKYDTYSGRAPASSRTLYKGIHIEYILKQGN